MLKALITEYDRRPAGFSNPGETPTIWELAFKAGICSDKKAGIFSDKKESMQDFCSRHPVAGHIQTAITEMKERGWIDGRLVPNHRSDQTCVSLLPAGIDEGRRLMRRWYRKVLDFFRGDVRTITVAVITAVVITLLTSWILRVLGW